MDPKTLDACKLVLSSELSAADKAVIIHVLASSPAVSAPESAHVAAAAGGGGGESSKEPQITSSEPTDVYDRVYANESRILLRLSVEVLNKPAYALTREDLEIMWVVLLRNYINTVFPEDIYGTPKMDDHMFIIKAKRITVLEFAQKHVPSKQIRTFFQMAYKNGVFCPLFDGPITET